MRNEKKNYVKRVASVVLSGVIGLVSFGVQAVESKDIRDNKISGNVAISDVNYQTESENTNINQVSDTVEVSKNQEKSEQLYRTKTGKCYHKEDCKCLKDSKIEVSEQEVKESGLKPCSKCHKSKNTDTKTSNNQEKSEQFYRTKSGKCYHNGNCKHLKNSKIEISLKEIKESDLKPCKNCCK